MFMRHTPGPWAPVNLDVVAPGEGGRGHSGSIMVVATVTRRNERGSLLYDGDETQANARLIAAAPDLLEALKILMEDYAEHEGCYCGQLIGGCSAQGGEPLGKCGYCKASAAIAKAEGGS